MASVDTSTSNDGQEKGPWKEWAERHGLEIIGGLTMTAILSSGFVVGLQRRKAREFIESQKVKKQKKLVKPPPQRQGNLAWWERALGVKSTKMSAGKAARTAFLGGTILAVTGCSFIVCGIAIAAGVSTPTELNDKLAVVVPRLRSNVAKFLGVKTPSGPTAEELEQEREHLAIIEDFFAKEEAEYQKKNQNSSSQ